MSNPTTRKYNYMSKEVWTRKTIAALLRFTLGLWTDRCNALHGVDDAANRKKRKQKLMDRIKKCFENTDIVPVEAQYIFKEQYGNLCKRSLQYLKKWITSYKLAVRGT